jgi:hypothetical protein
MEKETYSLFEYLGKPAGLELGKKVFEAAKQLKIKVTSQEIVNKKYTGKVLTYPKSFLDIYFETNQSDKLPF